jgi:hypothetical protein
MPLSVLLKIDIFSLARYFVTSERDPNYYWERWGELTSLITPAIINLVGIIITGEVYARTNHNVSRRESEFAPGAAL